MHFTSPPAALRRCEGFSRGAFVSPPPEQSASPQPNSPVAALDARWFVSLLRWVGHGWNLRRVFAWCACI
eukprot:722898-Prorocentrum_minimum.AAC.1